MEGLPEFEVMQRDYKAAFGQLVFMVGMINTALSKGNADLVDEMVTNVTEMVEAFYNTPIIIKK